MTKLSIGVKICKKFSEFENLKAKKLYNDLSVNFGKKFYNN